MAKRNKYDVQHDRNLSKYLKELDEIYTAACREAASIGLMAGELKPGTAFAFKDFPITHERLEKFLQKFNGRMETAIVNAVKSEWTLANNKNNELARRIFGDNVGKLTEEQYYRYFSNNHKALEAFLQRKEAGLNLSDRVWKYTNQFKEEIEMGLDFGIRFGRSADELSRDLRKYLKEPQKLFRRVRDEYGNLHLSKAAKAYHPGRGVYRSSYKNARRLTATETNIAYRTADHLRYQNLDFVVGIKIVTSNNHPVYDICDELEGDYPKDFKFTGWHPHCRCHVNTILKTPEELVRDTQNLLNGEEPEKDSVNTIKNVPGAFSKWVEGNKGRIETAKQLPYFVRDNKKSIADILKESDDNGGALASRYNDDYAKAMSEHGIIFNDDLIESMAENPYNRLDVVRLNDDIQGIFAEQGVTDLTCKMTAFPGGRVHLSWTGSGVVLKREFNIKHGTKVVEHELFSLNKKLQKRGVSRKVLESLYEQYQVAGVERIELLANIDVGGYAWARYGFCNKSREDLPYAINFQKLTTRQKDKIMKIIDDHFSSSDAPFPMNKIAELPYGKKALLGKCWQGVLDLTDSQQCGVFERYLRR